MTTIAPEETTEYELLEHDPKEYCHIINSQTGLSFCGYYGMIGRPEGHAFLGDSGTCEYCRLPACPTCQLLFSL